VPVSSPERAILAASVLFVSAFSWISAAARETHPADPVAARLIGVLDERIQERFKDTDKGFGITRMMPLGEFETDESGRLRLRRHRLGARIGRDNPVRFRAENRSEAETLREVAEAGFGVILYLGSRNGAVKGPVVLTVPASPDSAKQMEAMPSPAQLQDLSGRALQAFARAESYEFAVSGWRFITRPARATEKSCVECHAVALGDPVGVAIYGYKEVRP
jgi:hypothetical protein